MEDKIEKLTILDTSVAFTGSKNSDNSVLNIDEKTMLEKCEKSLKELMEQKEFNDEFNKMFLFYIYKLSNKINDNEVKDKLTSKFFDYCSVLLYQGYFLGVELLSSPDVVVKDSYFEQPNGIIREQIPMQLEEATKGLSQLLNDAETRKFESWILDNNKNVENIINQIKIDIACMGAYYAFLNEREHRGVLVRKEGKYGMLNRPDDFLFLDPQKFVTCLIANEKTEVWDIYLWSTIRSHNKKIGEISIMKFNTEETDYAYSNFAYYQGVEFIKSLYDKALVTIKVDEFMPERELNVIQSVVADRIANSTKIPFDNIDLNVTIFTSNVSYQYNPGQFN
ncbi:hypothetical protein ACMHYP_23165 [Bacillus cereus]|uniref:hypothetical protein n=1 Tax=Bacillus cereus group TaxID=86661 RepID=UPI003014A7B3